jgi:predicted outer membrane repeat protein
MRDALEFAGYKILDANQLKTWMDARISDGMPSVVVFCRDIAPDTVVESMSFRCTLRRYLDAGGKIVWYADIPMYYQGHVDGTRTGWGPNGSINILGFNAEGAPWDREEEVVFTREGLEWGLTETWQSKRPTAVDNVDVVLATDADGNAAAWVKHYVPGDSYRGFVRLFDQIGVPNFNDVRRVAEYPNVPEPIVYYVDDDATGANDGSSWADAYWMLQDALAAGRYGDEIRVAQGNYKPDQQVVITARGPQIRGSGDRTATFQLINGVSLKGGYAGFGETDPDARDIEAYRTILSGDLNGNDGPNFANNDENSYHVVTGSGTDETAVLEGFTITAGYANGFGNPNDSGGGMYSTSGSPTVINCTFSKNAAGYAGGMANRDYCSPTVINCTFVGNSAHSGGVGMFDWHSASTLINCSFSGNFGRYGAAMRIYDSDSTIINCSFSGNFARQYGGAIYVDRSDVTLTNCTFSSNSADYWELGCGGGIYDHLGNSSLTLTNCIFWNNSDSGGVDESAQIHGGTPVVNYCCIQGWTGTWSGLGNVGANPMFARNPNDGGDDWGVGNRKEFGDLLSIGRNDDFGDLHLRSQAGRWDTNSQSWIQDDVTSPCIDAGDNSAIPAGVIVDLDGNPRIINGIVDMGAYENSLTLSLRADNPSPADGATDVTQTPTLRWTAGDKALQHDVYFGTDEEAVRNANMRSPEYKDTKDLGSESFETGKLEWNTTYYWRVDEYNTDATISEGRVWSFTTGLDLVGWWKFDESSGTTAYDSAGDNHGTVYGAQWTTGQISGALSFDGVDDYVAMPGFNLTTNTATFVAWINGWKAGNWAGIVYSRTRNRDSCGMDFGSNNTLHYTWNDNSEETWGWEGGPQIPQNQWAMVALVIEPNKATAYVYTEADGLQQGINNIPHVSQTVENLKVGWDEHRDSRRFEGAIDDVRIYNRALSAEEIEQLTRIEQ